MDDLDEKAFLEKERTFLLNRNRELDAINKRVEYDSYILRDNAFYRFYSTFRFDTVPRKIFRSVYLIGKLILPERAKRILNPPTRAIKARMTPNTIQPVVVKPSLPVEVELTKWKKGAPLVSVVIPYHNYGRYIEQAVDSVLNQTFQNFEIIIVDDASTEPYSIDIIHSLKKPKTRVIFQEENTYIPGAFNNGVRHAKGKYICRLDADDKLKPTYLEKCLLKLELGNLDVCNTWHKEFGDASFTFERGILDIRSIVHENTQHCSAIFRRELGMKVGPYDSKIKGYEDWDFWISMAEQSAASDIVHEPLLLYRRHGHTESQKSHDRHMHWVSTIRNKHIKAITNRKYIQNIVNKLKKYTVKNPLLNLLDADRTNDNQRTHILFVAETLGIEDESRYIYNFASKTKLITGANIGFVTTSDFESYLLESPYNFEDLTSDIFHLGKLYPNKDNWREILYYLIETRKTSTLIVSKSNFLYLHLPEIKMRYPKLQIVAILNDDKDKESFDLKEEHIDFAIGKLETGIGNTKLYLFEESNNLILNLDPQKRFVMKYSIRDDYNNISTFINDRAKFNEDKKNIMFIFPWLVAGGFDKLMLDTIAGLNPKEFNTHVFTTLLSNHTWEKEFKKLTPNMFHLSEYVNENFYFAFIKEYIKLGHIDTILIGNSQAGFDMIPEIKKVFPKIRIMDLIQAQGMKNEGGGYPKYCVQFDEHIETHIVASKMLKELMVNEYGVNPGKILVVHNGIDLNKFDPTKFEAGKYRKKFKMSAKDIVLSYLGRLNFDKSPEKLVEIANELINVRKIRNVKLIIAGGGPMLKELQTEVEDLKLNESVFFTDFFQNSEAPYILKDTDYSLIVSEMEGMPVSTLESMAMEVPVISTKVGGIPEMVEHGRDGFLIEYGNNLVNDFADLIVSLLAEDKKIVQGIGKNARETVEREFSLKEMQKAFNEILK
ncbi:MAG: glycosyltransferase [Candidatus Dojkabacteria bacterium]